MSDDKNTKTIRLEESRTRKSATNGRPLLTGREALDAARAAHAKRIRQSSTDGTNQSSEANKPETQTATNKDS